ncbi:MAG: amidohydrolase family protein [Candidatus Thorarchaeota archaeon]|nr:amidohydrolase family protein [Candidatus Thorarchaeota archaeon]
MSNHSFRYTGPIFDAHTHVIDIDALKMLVKVEDEYGISKALTIVHGESIQEYDEMFPGRFIYARYFSGWTLFTEGPRQAVEDVKTLRERGYDMAKIHFAPFWSDRLSDIEHVPPIDSHDFDVLFDALMDEDIPVLVHIGDPDTYFATRYTDAKVYGTKEDHISEFENRLHKNKELIFQAAHFAAQPEPHRLQNLARMFDNYPNLNVDLSSARWMCREFGRNPEQARDFLIKYVDRILFATDCVASKLDRNYYEGRHSSLRMLLESDVKKESLPFVDTDTVNSGGTFIYGLNLPENILEKLYWKNAEKIHNL